MIHGYAIGVSTTSCGVRAWVRALMVDTGQIIRTSSIGSASSAAGQSLANLSGATIIVSSTDGLACTIITSFVVQAARIVCAQWATHLCEAGESFGALTVLSARQGRRANTADLCRGTGHHSGDTRASGPVIGHGADGIRSTGIVLTRIVASVVAARLTCAAVFVRVAAKDTLIAQANVAQEAVVVHATGH